MIKRRTTRVSDFRLRDDNRIVQFRLKSYLLKILPPVIRCQAEFADVVDCHSPLRSLCEIATTCGSRGRPVICECVEWFDYPEPEFIGPEDERTSFRDACAQARANRTAASGEEL